MQISAFESAELQGTILALKGMDRELAAQIRKATRTITEAEWRKELAQEATTQAEERVLVATARTSVTNQNIALKSGAAAKKLEGGAAIHELTHSVEFGADREHRGTSTSATGKHYERRTRRQFKGRQRTGYVVYPAAADIIPRIAALWVQTTVRTFHEAIEKGTS